MQPTELTFCVHTIEEREGEECNEEPYKGLNVITFCPSLYWKKHECLPDYYFSDQIAEDLFPEGYQWYIFVEETQWVSKKSKEEIVQDLTILGFTENKEMENFLTNCW